MNAYTKILVAGLIGIIFFKALVLFWSSFANWNPIFNHLLSCCAQESWFRGVVLIQDLIVNFLLCLIPAYLLVKLKYKSLFIVLLVAVVPSFVWQNYHFLWPTIYNGNITIFFLGWFNELMLLPIVAVTLSFMIKRKKGI